jgi:hypothetical protein
LERFYLKEMIAMRQLCGRNWELLRQRAEAEGLYFEPLLLPDGTATHALLWVAREDLAAKRQNRFDDRFLSIGRPWGDKALLNWNGATEFRYFDSENRRVRSATEGTRRVELIPLALYGLYHPKIPVLLVDFRKPLNAKARELSRRVVEEIGTKVSTGSAFVNLIMRIGRTATGVVTRRIGVDFLQPSRMVSYSQLKMILSSSPGVSPEIRSEIARRLELVAFNPLENDLSTEVKLARSQYEALLSFAHQPEGLRIDLERDRRAELTPSAHGSVAKFAFRLGGVLSFGLYRHREKETSELHSLLEAQRRDINDRRFLDAVVRSGRYIDVRWDPLNVRETLRRVSANGSLADDALADTAFRIFDQTQDEDTRLVCMVTLYRLDTANTRRRLTRIAQNQSLDPKWRALSASYLSRSGDLSLIANIDDGQAYVLAAEGND